MPTRPSEAPRLVLCDGSGRIFDHPELLAVGVDGLEPERVTPSAWRPLPRGSDLYMLPGRAALAADPGTGAIVEMDEPDLVACSAFLAPGWVRDHRPAYRTRVGAPALPTFAYAAVGFADGGFWTTGARVDRDTRQDPWRFDADAVRAGMFSRLERLPDNRVVQQLSRCALDYGCRAAQNFALGRHEAPIPTSVACNAQCVGCISLQPDGQFRASHERITRRVTPQEIVELAEDHWSRVADGVVSFGQGCEGEPLLEADVLVEAVARLAQRRPRGTINLNSNASRPDDVARLADAGLDALRVSMNSARPDVYAAYYNPRHYDFGDVERSVVEMKRRGRHVSLNFLYFPGVSDTLPEIEALGDFVRRNHVDVVQVRNLNIDPELYWRVLPSGTLAPGVGVSRFVKALEKVAPWIAFGYFNPTRERYAALAARGEARACP
jgi:pyruvate-formate lyase-activating enzyme